MSSLKRLLQLFAGERQVRIWLAGITLDPVFQPPSSLADLFDYILQELERNRFCPGDLIFIRLANPGHAVAAFWACLLLDLVPAIIPFGSPPKRIDELANSFRAKGLIIGGRDCLDSNFRGAQSGGSTINVTVYQRNAPSLTNAGEAIILTTGTTGTASGCVFSIDSLLANAKKHSGSMNINSDDKVLVVLPLHFSFALVAQALSAFHEGVSLHFGSAPFNSRLFVDTLKREGVTCTSITPSIARQFLSETAELPKSLEKLSIGGAAIAPLQLKAIMSCNPGLNVYVTYGLTEAGPRVSTLHCNSANESELASAGAPLPGTEVKLRALPDGGGELLVKSDTLMLRRIGQIDNPLKTRGLLDGYLPTGDVCELDAKRYLYFRNRLGDVINRKGHKICLSSIKRIVCAVPGVVGAKMRLDGDGGESSRMELQIYLASGCALKPIDFERFLKRELTLAERPDCIECFNHSVYGEYK